MAGGRASRDKGNRFEVCCVNELRALGVECQRVPLSGSAGGMFGHDITVRFQGRDIRIEAKKRARAWADLYQWIEPVYALFIARDRAEPLVVMRLSDFAALAKGPAA